MQLSPIIQSAHLLQFLIEYELKAYARRDNLPVCCSSKLATGPQLRKGHLSGWVFFSQSPKALLLCIHLDEPNSNFWELFKASPTLLLFLFRATVLYLEKKIPMSGKKLLYCKNKTLPIFIFNLFFLNSLYL